MSLGINPKAMIFPLEDEDSQLEPSKTCRSHRLQLPKFMGPSFPPRERSNLTPADLPPQHGLGEATGTPVSQGTLQAHGIHHQEHHGAQLELVVPTLGAKPRTSRGEKSGFGVAARRSVPQTGNKTRKRKRSDVFFCHPNMGWGWMNRTCCRGRLTVKAFPTDKQGTVPKVDHWLLQRDKLQKQTCQRGQVPKVHGNVKAT